MQIAVSSVSFIKFIFIFFAGSRFSFEARMFLFEAKNGFSFIVFPREVVVVGSFRIFLRFFVGTLTWLPKRTTLRLLSFNEISWPQNYGLLFRFFSFYRFLTRNNRFCFRISDSGSVYAVVAGSDKPPGKFGQILERGD